MAYRYGTIVRLTTDDPRNESMTKGTIIIEAGKLDEFSYRVLDPDSKGFATVTGEIVAVYGPSDAPMSENAAKEFARERYLAEREASQKK